MEFYHYCDANAFLSIIKNKEFWMSDLRNVNDPHELMSSPPIINEIYNSVFPEIKKEIFSDDLKDEDESVFFSLSLSKNSDVLSQWRAYSINGSGFQIGVDVEALKACNFGDITGHTMKYKGIPGVPLITFNDVFYSESDFFSFIENKMTEFRRSVGIPFERIGNDVRLSDFIFLNELYKCRCLLKHEFYKEEKEVRVFSTLDYTRIKRFGYYKNTAYKGGVPSFRVNHLGIVPYLPIKVVEHANKIQALTTVTLGPNNKSKVRDVEMFLELNGFEGVKVRKSEGIIR